MYLLIGIIIPLLVAWWVASDATKRGYSKGAVIGWFLGVWLILIVFLPLYFILRPKSRRLMDRSEGPFVCPYCGSLYPEKVTYCPYCGKKVGENGS